MLRLAFDFIITWRETRTRPNAYKQMTKTALALVVALSAGYGVYKSKLSELALANVEALAQSEGGDYEFKDGYLYSTTCNVAIGSSFLGTKRCKVEVIVCQGGGSGCNSKKCPVHPS